jgi:hypothetical protein
VVLCSVLHFDALILGGCKFYCLWKKGCEDISKCKGYKKSKGEELTFEDFETMTVFIINFRSPPCCLAAVPCLNFETEIALLGAPSSLS